MNTPFLTKQARWHFAWIILLAAGATWMLVDAAAQRARSRRQGTGSPGTPSRGKMRRHIAGTETVQRDLSLVMSQGRLPRPGASPGDAENLGPMGKALVPIAGRAAAEQFKNDHYGTRILTAGEITIEVLREIAGKPLRPPAQ